jgi:hypothetical protein
MEETERGVSMAVLYCGCGHKVWSELWWKELKHELLFFDDLEKSETYGERLTYCPGCSQQLSNKVLRSANDGHSMRARRSRETV